ITEYGYQGTPMALDIAAIQSLYGANMSYNTGDDVYVLPDSNIAGTFYSAIWDAGGIDAISALTATDDVIINLNDAPLVGKNAGGYVSAVEDVYGGFTIANGVDIEVAVGGSGDDTLVGNEVDNLLYGLGGSDSLYGGSGDDLLNGYGGTSGEYDILSGDYSYSEPDKEARLDGADTFVLGDASGAYYLGNGYATITDFYWAEGDKFEVYGSQSDYSLGFESWSGGEAIDTLIYYQSDLIGVVQDTTDVIASLDFTFV
ncbi:MAG: M10 family metallopeptidase C-terminal domain-containing protein, partial [Nodosilinea sp.]